MTTVERFFQATGRRKRAVARVRLTPGADSVFVVDGKPLEERFPLEIHRRSIMQPLVATDSVRRFAITVKVSGGGVTGQAEAIRHGIARALINLDISMRPVLKKAGFLTRDAREKERKKYGLFRARKKQQYSKR
jgi:small subunit ribosomal protein S9